MNHNKQAPDYEREGWAVIRWMIVGLVLGIGIGSAIKCHALPVVEPATASKSADVREWLDKGPGNRAPVADFTGSMRPYLTGWETLLCEPVRGRPLKRGMLLIVATPSHPHGVVHECVNVDWRGYVQTKGLNCAQADGWFRSQAVRFIVRRVIK